MECHLNNNKECKVQVLVVQVVQVVQAVKAALVVLVVKTWVPVVKTWDPQVANTEVLLLKACHQE
jgi:hypothetical protein